MTDEELMKIALSEGVKALKHDDVPVGAIVVVDGGLALPQLVDGPPQLVASLTDGPKTPFQLPRRPPRFGGLRLFN